MRTLDVFLGYATFREELGGNPRRGILFEGPPGTGKTYLAKAMAKQAGVPFLFISAPAFSSMWQGMSARRVRSFFKALRKARAQGGRRDRVHRGDRRRRRRPRRHVVLPAAADGGLARTVSNFGGGDSGSMVNELLIQMQSFDQPPWRDRMKARMVGWVNALPARRPAAPLAAPRVQQHPADRGHEPRRPAGPRAAAARPVRPPAVLRPADEAGARASSSTSSCDRKSHHEQLDERRRCANASRTTPSATRRS